MARGELPQGDVPAELAGAVREALRRHTVLFLGIQEASALLTRASLDYPEAVKEVLRVIPMQRLADIFRRLVEEEVPVRHTRDMLEALAEAGQREKDVFTLAEFARIALKRHISHRHAPDGLLRATLLLPDLEEQLRQALRTNGGVQQLAIDPQVARQVIDLIRQSVETHGVAAIVTTVDLRRHVRKLIELDCFDVPVLSYHELMPSLRLDVGRPSRRPRHGAARSRLDRGPPHRSPRDPAMPSFAPFSRRSAAWPPCCWCPFAPRPPGRTPPYAERKVQLAAREQPIAAFLQDLFGLIDVPVSVSPAVKGAVNGTFNGEAEGIARSISRAFGLVMYYDGAVMHVYTAGEMGARTLPTTPAVADRVLRAAGEMRLADARNTLRTTRDGAVIASGTNRFIEQVEELTRASQVSQVRAAAHGASRSSTCATRGRHDVTVAFSGRQIIVPGVASIVRSLVTFIRRAAPRCSASRSSCCGPRSRSSRARASARIPAQPVLGLPDANAQPGTADVLMAAYGGAAGGGAWWERPSCWATCSRFASRPTRG